mgnify:CR=1 FL=1
MATNDKRLRVTEFDFDDVKDNLKTFLKAQNEFKDYDFEGSGMNILVHLKQLQLWVLVLRSPQQ